ncbi:hypothetical protein DPMN_099837 [Dreissena polymorpha]|uniref:Uncharacterized protein n=1 Tax=Dreissena polymorpha TaxID=45954 RepID=A0A9D4LI07_DREPO|nr:hypothetical protein DPMN_099837 [Dreissena polymorpha]
MTSWQSSNHGQSCGGQTHSSDFIEEDIDDILMMLQNDNQSGAGRSKCVATVMVTTTSL